MSLERFHKFSMEFYRFVLSFSLLLSNFSVSIIRPFVGLVRISSHIVGCPSRFFNVFLVFFWFLNLLFAFELPFAQLWFGFVVFFAGEWLSFSKLCFIRFAWFHVASLFLSLWSLTRSHARIASSFEHYMKHRFGLNTVIDIIDSFSIILMTFDGHFLRFLVRIRLAQILCSNHIIVVLSESFTADVIDDVREKHSRCSLTKINTKKKKRKDEDGSVFQSIFLCVFFFHFISSSRTHAHKSSQAEKWMRAWNILFGNKVVRVEIKVFEMSLGSLQTMWIPYSLNIR